MANSHPKGGPASFRPSELQNRKHKGTFETNGNTHSREAQGVHTTTKFEKRRMPTSLLSRQRPVPLSSLRLFSLTTSLLPVLSQPVHGERRASLLRQRAPSSGCMARCSHNVWNFRRKFDPLVHDQHFHCIVLFEPETSKSRECFI